MVALHSVMKMRIPRLPVTSVILTFLLSLSLLSSFTDAARVTNPKKVPKTAVLLSKVSSLTLRNGKPTAHRRASAVPQLRCVGPSHICRLYEVDVMRCKNEGADYDENNIQWTCTASLPEEFKLGSTDVTCEGYESSDDQYVLKGSCGVEYRLLLSEAGEEKYGKETNWNFPGKTSTDKFASVLFWVVFWGVVVVIVVSALGCFPRGGLANRGGRRGGGGGGPGGGGGGGGGRWGDDPRDPPPPYDPRPPSKPSTSRSNPRAARNEAWRPGFWTGTLGGAAAGYMAGRGNNQGRQQQQQQQQPAVSNGFWGRSNSAGESSSRPSGSSSAASSFSSSRHESSGFGSTSRR